MNEEPMTPEIQRKLGIEAGMAFQPSTPIGAKDMFSGRIKQIQMVFDTIFQTGQHAIIYGERGVGKTSLANVLKDLLPPQQGHLSSVRVQCNAEDTFESIWYRIFNTMQLTKQEKTVGFAPESNASIVGPGHFFSQSDFFSPDSVRNALLTVSSIYQIIIIDEFDRTNEGVKKMFADLIKNLSDYAIRSTIIIIGVGESVDDLIKEHASIARSLKQIQMPRMTKEEIDGIIKHGVSVLKMEIPEDSLSKISLMTQGLPYFAHLLGLNSVRIALNDFNYTIESKYIKDAIKDAINDSQQSIKTEYNNAIFSARKDNIFQEVILACALAVNNAQNGEFTAQDVCSPLSKIKNKSYIISSFARHLNEFTSPNRNNILVKTGMSRKYRYKFRDPLMQPFVIMNGLLDGKILDSNLV